MQQLIRRQDVSQFTHWELWQVRKGILAPTIATPHNLVDETMYVMLELFVNKD